MAPDRYRRLLWTWGFVLIICMMGIGYNVMAWMHGRPFPWGWVAGYVVMGTFVVVNFLTYKR